ncbi:uncharacterized protein B0T15DRAFT_573368 [Chaetomium strumarium]|uniref:NACHT domain-containing protein n=1 Tax=Chaetomium strumarium TaxID=1170767 RepID=A0AAJ0GUD4_9PEZI|nr:hypothetical protein B0T15DRAFT_573368 [Chaetomium strumarium]
MACTEDHTKRSIKHMLTAIAFQIVLRSKSFRQRLLDLHDARNFSIDRLQAVNVWTSVFQRELFQEAAEKPMFWVIDGLDEADHPELLIRLLSKLEPHCGLRKIIQNPHGSFLWVALAVEQLQEHWHTPDTLSQALEGLPQSMEAFYDRMIQTIASQPERPRLMASRILAWAMCSLRPLGLQELQEVLAAEFGAFLNLEDSVSQLCANFVIVRKSQVTLIHETARSFLLDRDSGRLLLLKPQSEHEYIAKACLKFLMDPKKDWRRVLTISKQAAFDNHPFLSYAISCWAHHASHAPPSANLAALVQTFLNKSALDWIHAVALLGDIRVLTRAGESLRTLSDWRTDTTHENLLQWSRDLSRFPGRFGRILALNPLAIYQQIVPFCPTQSMIRRHFGQFSTISVSGVSESSWGNCVGRLMLGKTSGFIKRVVCQGPYVIAVTEECELIVASAESCDEIKRITLEEVWKDKTPILAMANSGGSSLLAAADGRRVRIWDLATGEEVLSIPHYSGIVVLALAFKNDDEHLLWDLQSDMLRRLPHIRSMEFAFNFVGTLLACVTDGYGSFSIRRLPEYWVLKEWSQFPLVGRYVCLPDAAEMEPILDSSVSDDWPPEPDVISVLLDPSGWVYLTRDWFTEPIHNTTKGKTPIGNQDKISIISLGNTPTALSPSGRYVATGNPDLHVIVYAVSKFESPESYSLKINSITHALAADKASYYIVLEIGNNFQMSRTTFTVDFGDPTKVTQPRFVEGASDLVNYLIGSCQDHVVFLDYDYCVCTWDLRVGPASLKRHFYLPKDWLDRDTLDKLGKESQAIIRIKKQQGRFLPWFTTPPQYCLLPVLPSEANHQRVQRPARKTLRPPEATVTLARGEPFQCGAPGFMDRRLKDIWDNVDYLSVNTSVKKGHIDRMMLVAIENTSFPYIPLSPTTLP